MPAVPHWSALLTANLVALGEAAATPMSKSTWDFVAGWAEIEVSISSNRTVFAR
ncbi:hypothetical protein AB0M48_12785 [Lentzea sp. NPDC051208]|uniref:hypothetical protein n=1 Tax=Lentzea sp. NPDC051208 TaxID=3154642 RepID=UPI0034164D5E